MMKKILIALVAILALTQCKQTNTPGENGGSFATKVTEYGVYKDVTPIIAYNIDKHQTLVSKTPNYRFVMQNDAQTEYFSVEVSSLPDQIDLSAEIEIKASGVDGLTNGKRTMKLVRITEDKAWLWSEQELIGVVVAVPIY